ncbi:MAG: hypothetical protein M1815_002501 [Lichina confinis]|nr:MAG: hypothetical protein M1815_002501 [Lichina confinis]
MQSSAFFRAVVPTAQFRGISSRASKALTPSSISTPNGVSSYGLSELAPVVKLRDFNSAVAKPGVDDGGYTGVTSNKTELGMLVPKNEMKIGRDRDRDRSGRELFYNDFGLDRANEKVKAAGKLVLMNSGQRANASGDVGRQGHS